MGLPKLPQARPQEAFMGSKALEAGDFSGGIAGIVD